MPTNAFTSGFQTGLELLRQNRINKQMDIENKMKQTIFDKSQAAESTVSDFAKKLAATGEDATLPFTSGMGPSAAEYLNERRPTGRMSLEDKKIAFMTSVGKAPEKANALSALYNIDPEVSEDKRRKELAGKEAELMSEYKIKIPLEVKMAQLKAEMNRDAFGEPYKDSAGNWLQRNLKTGKVDKVSGVEGESKELKVVKDTDSPTGWSYRSATGSRMVGAPSPKESDEKQSMEESRYKFLTEKLGMDNESALSMAFGSKGKTDEVFAKEIFSKAQGDDPSEEGTKAAQNAAKAFMDWSASSFGKGKSGAGRTKTGNPQYLRTATDPKTGKKVGYNQSTKQWETIQ